MIPPHVIELGAVVVGATACAVIAYATGKHKGKKQAPPRARSGKLSYKRPSDNLPVYDDTQVQDAVDLAPLRTWQQHHPEFVREQAAARRLAMVDVKRRLVRGGKEVVKGDIVPLGGENSGRQVKILDTTPNADGGISVQENYAADPAALGVEVRVNVDLNADEAAQLLDFYQRQSSGTPAGETTLQNIAPTFNALK